MRAFFIEVNKTKAFLKFLWRLLIVNLRIPGLIWRGTAYFVQNKTTIILPADTRRLRASCHAGRWRPIFGAKLKARRHKMFHIFSLFTIRCGFGYCKSIFVNIYFHLQWRKLPDFNTFLGKLHWRQDGQLFPACWIQICCAPVVYKGSCWGLVYTSKLTR